MDYAPFISKALQIKEKSYASDTGKKESSSNNTAGSKEVRKQKR